MRALWEYNRALGGYWAELGQGGVYCCAEAEELVELARREGYYLIQSSWGPALWTVADCDRSAAELARLVAGWASRRGLRVSVWVTEPDNYGAVAWPGHVMEWRTG